MKTPEELVAFSATVEGQGTEDHQNCTYLTTELLAIAKQLVTLRRYSTVMEIGVYGGRTASLYFQLQKDLDLEIHLIDNWSWDAIRAMSTFSHLVIDNFSEVPFTLHKMRSDEATHLTATSDFYINFLHIDGWHDFDGIDFDCRFWLPWVQAGGIAVFHDSDCPPVWECIQKYCAGWELIETAARTTVWRKPCR